MEFGTALVLSGVTAIFVGTVSGAIIGALIFGTGEYYADNNGGFLGKDYSIFLARICGAFLGGINGLILGLINVTTNCSKPFAAICGGIAGAITAAFVHMASLKNQDSTPVDAIPIEEYRLFFLLACIPAGALVSLISSWSSSFR